MCRVIVLVVAVLFMSQAQARGADPVTDQAGYESLVEAGIGAEIVRFELALDPNPRVAVAAASLAAFAERNPRASAQQLAAYAVAVDAALAAFDVADPELRLPSTLSAAARFGPRAVNNAALVGSDLNVGSDAMDLLGIGFEPGSRSIRAVDFDQAGAVALESGGAFADLIVAMLRGITPSGRSVEGLRQALLDQLALAGIDPFPADLAAAYPEIAAARAALPADFAAYQLAQANAFADQRTAITSEIGVVSARIDANRAVINTKLAQNPDQFEAAKNAVDPVLMAQILQDREQALRDRALSRSTLALNTLLLAQGDSGTQEFARQARDFSDAQLQVDTAMSDIGIGLEIGGNLLNAASQYAMGNPAAAVGSVLLAAGAAMGLVDEAAPPPEEQIFSEIVALRQQVEDLRVEMNARFDSIDRQLGLIYEAMSSGLNEINETTRRLERGVDAIQVELYALKSSLASLEANLYGVLSAGFEQGFVQDMETALGFRRRTGVDLEFVGDGSNSFFGFLSRFATWANAFSTDETYAGPAALTLANDGTASAELLGNPLGYQINNLRRFPTQLGLPSLGFGRVANPTTWSFAADAYAQLARENPWYYAKIYENDPSTLQTIIDTGTSTRSVMAAARDRALFESLLGQYVGRVDALEVEIGVAGYLASVGIGPLDPWAGSAQDIRGVGPDLEIVGIPFSNSTEAVFFDKRLCWEPFDSRFALAASMNLPGYTLSRYDWEWGVTFTEGELEWRAYFFFQDANRGPTRGYFENLFNYVGPVQGPPPEGLDYFRNHPEVFEALIRAEVGDLIEGPGGYQMQVGDFDLRETLPSGISSAVSTRLTDLQSDFWSEINSRLALPQNQDILASLASSQELLSAYTSIGLPDALRQNDAVRGALRGDAAVRSGLNGAWIQGAYDEAFLLGDKPPAFGDTLRDRADVLIQQLGPALDAPNDELHPYLSWSLASLIDLRDNALDLSVDDSYLLPPDQSSVVGAASGVLANDAQQPGAASIVAALIFPATNGSVTLQPDGGFTYQPNPGFEGFDTFRYIATANLAEPNELPNLVTASPATVVIEVRAVEVCVTDVTTTSTNPGQAGYGEADGVSDGADLSYYVERWLAGDLLADLTTTSTNPGEPGYGTPDGVTNGNDLSYFVEFWLQGCP